MRKFDKVYSNSESRGIRASERNCFFRRRFIEHVMQRWFNRICSHESERNNEHLLAVSEDFCMR